MYRKYTIKAYLVLLLLSLVGCSAPSALTKVHDATYQGRVSELEMLLVVSKFASLPKYMKYADGINDPDWYKLVAEGMEKNFHHNDVALSSKIVNDRMLLPIFLSKRSKVVPTLVIYADKVAVARNSGMASLSVNAIMYAPQRSKPVWRAITDAAPYKASDELSLKILNELSRLKLVKLPREEAETVSGYKKATFGGLLTK